MKVALSLTASLVIGGTVALGCASLQPPRTTADSSAPVAIEALWREPSDLPAKDLFAGPGGVELAPASDRSYEFVAHKTTGTQRGYDVRDASGRVWSVKLGVEAQAEVVSSRVLWAIGYHQPPTYFVGSWTLSGGAASAGPQAVSRFRHDPDGTSVVGDWSWYKNPFADERPFKGLIVANLILNNWDFKTANNKIYEVAEGKGEVRRRYVVRDLGASLGLAKQSAFWKFFGIPNSQGTKNDIDGFESQPFIERVDGDRITFAYRGVNTALVRSVSIGDVQWACALLAKIADAQWHEAFRAGGYPLLARERYIKKMKAKIAEGLSLRPAS
jgi:hypothetical protein